MRINCELTSLLLKGSDKAWTKSALVDAVLKCLDESGFKTDFKWYRHYAEERCQWKAEFSISSLLEKCPDLTLYCEQEAAYPQILLELRSADELRLFATIEGETLGPTAGWFLRFVELVHRDLNKHVSLGSTMNISIDMELPKLRPPRIHAYLIPSASWDLVSRGALEDLAEDEEDRASLLQEFVTLATAPLPAGVERRVVDEDLLILKWIGDEAHDNAVRSGIVKRAMWLLQNITMQCGAQYTEEGDAYVFAHDVEEHQEVTFYDQDEHIAYQTAIAPKGQIDRKLIETWNAWLDCGYLPDGTRLRQLNIIVPNRMTALSVHDELIDIGIYKVFYTGNEGAWLDPFPDGDWINFDSDDS